MRNEEQILMHSGDQTASGRPYTDAGFTNRSTTFSSVTRKYPNIQFLIVSGYNRRRYSDFRVKFVQLYYLPGQLRVNFQVFHYDNIIYLMIQFPLGNMFLLVFSNAVYVSKTIPINICIEVTSLGYFTITRIQSILI